MQKRHKPEHGEFQAQLTHTERIRCGIATEQPLRGILPQHKAVVMKCRCGGQNGLPGAQACRLISSTQAEQPRFILTSSKTVANGIALTIIFLNQGRVTT